MQRLTFINYDARHRTSTRRDVSIINTHVARRAHQRRADEQLEDDEHSTSLETKGFRTFLLPSIGYQIGGLRTEPFNMFPIESKGFVPEAFDYCEHVIITPS